MTAPASVSLTLLAALAAWPAPSAPAGVEPATPDERLSRLERDLERERAEQAARRGARTFARACAVCHGRRGRGDGPGAADLDPPPRDLTTRQFRFRSTASGELPRPEDLERSIRRGLSGSSMPAFGELLSRDEMSDLIAFLYALQPEPPARPPDAVRVAPVAPPTPEALRDGRALYLLLGCASCHGLDGSGRGAVATNLADEKGRPLRATNFRRDPWKGGRAPEAVVRTLRTGLNGAPMPSYDDAMLFGREDPDVGTLPEGVTASDESAVESLLRAAPSRAELEAMTGPERDALRDRRLASLAHYVLSLGERAGFWFRLLREEPERRARVTRHPPSPPRAERGCDSWGE